MVTRIPDGLPDATRAWLAVLAWVLCGACIAVTVTSVSNGVVALVVIGAALVWLLALGTCAWKAGRGR